MEIRRLGANAYSARTGEIRRESLLAEKVLHDDVGGKAGGGVDGGQL